jgi:hypothetical protein
MENKRSWLHVYEESYFLALMTLILILPCKYHIYINGHIQEKKQSYFSQVAWYFTIKSCYSYFGKQHCGFWPKYMQNFPQVNSLYQCNFHRLAFSLIPGRESCLPIWFHFTVQIPCSVLPYSWVSRKIFKISG